MYILLDRKHEFLNFSRFVYVVTRPIMEAASSSWFPHSLSPAANGDEHIKIEPYNVIYLWESPSIATSSDLRFITQVDVSSHCSRKRVTAEKGRKWRKEIVKYTEWSLAWWNCYKIMINVAVIKHQLFLFNMKIFSRQLTGSVFQLKQTLHTRFIHVCIVCVCSSPENLFHYWWFSSGLNNGGKAFAAYHNTPIISFDYR